MRWENIFKYKLWQIWKHFKFVVSSKINSSQLFFSESLPPLFSFSTYLTYCVFSTLTMTLIPKIAFSTSHPLRRDKGSWKGVKGVKVSPRQSGRFCQRVACSHSSASAAPPNDSAMTTLYQSKALCLWPHKLPGAPVKVRDRQTDYTACL